MAMIASGKWPPVKHFTEPSINHLCIKNNNNSIILYVYVIHNIRTYVNLQVWRTKLVRKCK